MSKPELPSIPGAWESRAFFAALLAACRGDDKTAGDILRQIAQNLTKDFVVEGGVKSGETSRGG